MCNNVYLLLIRIRQANNDDIFYADMMNRIMAIWQYFDTLRLIYIVLF